MFDDSTINSPAITGGDRVPDIVGGEGYQDPAEFPPLPPDGVYDLAQGQADFEERDGALHVIFGDPRNGNKGHTITGGEQDGKTITFDRISTKTFLRNSVKAASVIDHLRSLGLKQGYDLNDHETLKTIIAGAEGRVFKAQIRWEGICPDCLATTEEAFKRGTPEYKKAIKKVTLQGEKRWPKLPDKPRTRTVECRDHGTPIMARVRIARRIPA